MNAILPYTNPHGAAKLLEWVVELGGVKNHHLILLPFKGLDAASVAKIGERAFASVRIEPDCEGVVTDWSQPITDGKPRSAAGANSMMRTAAWFAHLNNIGPWMFWEPDAVPLDWTWLNKLEAEYLASGKQFMGAYVARSASGTPEHLTGNAIYPQDAVCFAPSLSISGDLAFDVAAAQEILPRAHHTKLIQHVFFYPEYPHHPTFPDQDSLKLIRSDAVIFHRNKDLSLIDRLREKRGGTGAVQIPEGAPIVVERPLVHPNLVVRPEPAKPKVHTYFRPGHGEFVEEQKRLLAVWEREWKAAGFEPVILTEDDARKHPRFEEWSKALLAKPTVNPPGFEAASWLRWIAMAHLGGGLMTDYDVVPNGFTPERAVEALGSVAQPFPILLCKKVPCAVVGVAAAYENALNAFVKCKPIIEQGKPHLSDMHAAIQLDFQTIDLCAEYFASGWKTAPLIHFPHRRCNPQARSQVIEQALKELRAPEVTVLHESAEPETVVGQMRRHIDALVELAAANHSRRIILHSEMRKKGLIAPAKRQKRKNRFAV